MKTEIETFIAWAVDSRSKEGHGLIGRYWWVNNKVTEIPPHLEGCKLVLFKTRALARKNLRAVKQTFKNARVVKAKITVEANFENSARLIETKLAVKSPMLSV